MSPATGTARNSKKMEYLGTAKISPGIAINIIAAWLGTSKNKTTYYSHGIGGHKLDIFALDIFVELVQLGVKELFSDSSSPVHGK